MTVRQTLMLPVMKESTKKNIKNIFISKFLQPFKNECWEFCQGNTHSKSYNEINNYMIDICHEPERLYPQFKKKIHSNTECQKLFNNFINSSKSIINGNIQWIFPGHPHYPKKLYINKKHQSFFAIGNTAILSKKIFTIIGSRKTSASSQKIASQLGFYINDMDHTIASGGAIGIDIASQLRTLNKRTSHKNILVVLPGGICNIVPKCHERVIKKITQNNGCLISSPHPYARTPRFSYILRNHFLVNISETLFVVQANNRSGALSTAEYARDQGVQTTVWNGELNDIRSVGSRRLIAEGAQHFSHQKDFPFII